MRMYTPSVTARVEPRDTYGQHPVGRFRVIKRLARAPATDVAFAGYPDQRFTPRNGILVIRSHPQS
jgi:hypothetical protein